MISPGKSMVFKGNIITLDKAHRLEKLVNEFFEITRYNLQQIDLKREKIDLYYMLVQMIDKFYRLDDARTSSTGDSGMGLAIAKEIVALHGGTISARSGGGVTAFTIILLKDPFENNKLPLANS